MQILSPEEIQRLLIQAKEDSCFELLLLELSTGLRRGEIYALQWSDLNFRTGELRVERQVHHISGELVASPSKTKAGKAGTGCISQINERLWEGRYSPVWPDGKKHPRNIYAHTEEECEKLLAAMIAEMKMEIAAEKKQLAAGPIAN